MTMQFADLGVPTVLTDLLEREGKTTAFPIQADTLPSTLAGRDVLGRGKTGSGKTLAFAIPLVARLGSRGGRAKPGHPRALVLAPTRELATQIDAVVAPLAAAYGLRTATVFGGVAQQRQERALQRGADIVVACPGRLEDLMRQRIVHMDAVQVTVLDEADHMADLGFLPGVTRIMEATPENGQRMLFSATLDNDVDRLVRRFLDNPVTHSVDSADSHVDAMTHHVFHVSGSDAKREVVRALASGTGRRVLFMRTKHQAQRLAEQLTASGIPAVDLHGNLSQAKRDRNLAAFAGDRARVLVATDVAARGVHVDGIELVVHVDPPAEHKAYLHRSGRTARAGTSGDVVTVVLPEQRRETDRLMRAAKISVQPVAVAADSRHVVDLVGQVAPYVAPRPVVADEPRTRSGRGQQASRNSQPGKGEQGGRPGRGRQSGQRDDARVAGGSRPAGAARRDASRHDGARHDGNRHDSARPEGNRHDGPRREGNRQDGARREANRYDGSRRDTSGRDNTRREGGNRDSSNRTSGRGQGAPSYASRAGGTGQGGGQRRQRPGIRARRSA